MLSATLSLTVIKGDQAPLVFEKSFVSVGYRDNRKENNAATGGTGNGAITYSIDNTNVATVDNNGQLTLKSIGKATVTASKAGNANYNTTTNSYELTVNDKKEQSALIFARSSITLDYKKGGVTTSNVATGGDGTGAISYRSDNDKVATVNNNGVVTIKGAGKTKIRATKAEDREYNPTEASYDLTVNKIAQTGFGFAQSTVTATYLDKPVKHTATGGEGNGLITYDSNNTSVVTVDKDGVVTIKGAGTVIITANKAEDTNYKATQASYALVVNKAQQTGFHFTKDVFTTAYQANKKISNTPIPQGGQGEGAITYRIDKESVATIDEGTGELTITGRGKAIIIATKEGNDDYLPTSATYSLRVIDSSVTFTLGIKNIKFAWTDIAGTDHYRLESKLGGSGFVDASTSGFVVVPNSTNIKQTNAGADIALHRYIPVVNGNNPEYLVEACDAGNVCNSNASASLTNEKLNDLIGYFKASNTDRGDNFGYSVGISGDGNTLAVAAPGEASNSDGVNGDQSDNSISVSGAVYVFTRSSTGTWQQQAYIKASNSDRVDEFSYLSISGDGNTLAVGAIGEDSTSIGVDGEQNDRGDDLGAVYVFIRSGEDWSQQAYIKASNAGKDDVFGFSVSLSDDGNSLAVGARFEDSNAKGVDGTQNNESARDSGAVYVFTRSGSTWQQQAYIKASNTGAGDRFGHSVSLSGDGDTLAVGAYLEDSNAKGVNSDSENNDSAADSGAVYVFTRSSTGTWSQKAYIKASNTGAGDQFGFSVSISDDGNTLAVGARYEASNAKGVDGVQNNDSASTSGATYFFTRTDSTWQQQAYIKANNTGINDQFGSAVSLSGDGHSLAVGAINEDSNATGVGGTQDGGSDDSGAVYFFTRSGDTWQQQAYIKATNTGKDDLFGWSVSLSDDGNSLAVGAYAEDSNATGVSRGTQAQGKDVADYESGAVYLY